MECIYCGTETEYLTTTDEPICNHCAEKRVFYYVQSWGNTLLIKILIVTIFVMIVFMIIINNKIVQDIKGATFLHLM
uniref:Uncharacterized protein n=1 Tax=uncultured Bacillota bacterium TaxID=344338 RepID=A0A650EMV8_9FIRM|nr:hypothetical protein Firmicute1046_0590 [uncultured Firmicutes bacterium]